MMKRLFDIAGSSLALICLSPLFLVIAVAIKLDSPGPVMFRQERVGRHGRLFRIHKFRTMRGDAPALGPAVTVGVDPRITRIGPHSAPFIFRAPVLRLDPRFRLPDGVWDQLPQYARFGFAVFKLKEGKADVHPMAFTFPRCSGSWERA